eukprot:COSAG02_NODE_14573_length_1258_cov_2.554789_1_plen_276_part_01
MAKNAGDVIGMLTGSSMERAAWNRKLCDELCAAVRAAPSPTSGSMDFEGRNLHGDTPFLLACNQGHVDCMQLLARAGCNTGAKSSDGANALHQAAKSGEVAAVHTVLDAGWCELEATDKHGFTGFLLACACNQGHADCMRLLADAGCNTGVKCIKGANALHQAANSGEVTAVHTVLDAGWCALEATDKHGRTAFLLACSKGYVDCMQLLAAAGCNTGAKCSEGANALHHTVHSGEVTAVHTVLDAGWCELEATDKGGATAFVLACNKGYVDCMQLL